jgi:hypothetical protein
MQYPLLGKSVVRKINNGSASAGMGKESPRQTTDSILTFELKMKTFNRLILVGVREGLMNLKQVPLCSRQYIHTYVSLDWTDFSPLPIDYINCNAVHEPHTKISVLYAAPRNANILLSLLPSLAIIS